MTSLHLILEFLEGRCGSHDSIISVLEKIINFYIGNLNNICMILKTRPKLGKNY